MDKVLSKPLLTLKGGFTIIPNFILYMSYLSHKIKKNKNTDKHALLNTVRIQSSINNVKIKMKKFFI